MNKKILVAGTELHLLQFWIEHINYFCSLGYDVEVVTTDCSGRMDELKTALSDIKINIICSKRSPLSVDNIKAYKQLKKLFAHTHYDCVLTNEPVMSILIRLAARKSRKTGTKIVYMAHGFHFFKGNKKLNNIIFHFIEKNMSKITDAIVLSNMEDYHAAEDFKTGVSLYHIDGMGCKSYKFIPCNDLEKRLEKRRLLNINDDETALVFAGELNRNKNQIVLVKGIKILVDNGYKVKLMLCGKGDQLENLQSYCKENGITDNVVFLGYRKDVAEIFPVCDIGCSSSIREGFGLNVAEYMACGLPVVVSRNRAHVDIVEINENGYIFDFDNPQGFADGVKKIIDNSDLAKKMRENNIKKSEKYDIKKISETIACIISDMIKKDKQE